MSHQSISRISQRIPYFHDYKAHTNVFDFFQNVRRALSCSAPYVCACKADEVPLTFDIPVSHTVEKKGTSTVMIHTTGYEKALFTVVLGCHANGQKLPPMVIFKRKTLPKETFPAGVIIKANEKGWMDEDMMKEWLGQVYVRRPGGFFHTSPSLLICDSMRAHLTDDVKQKVKQMNVTLAVIPGGLTKELQPLELN